MNGTQKGGSETTKNEIVKLIVQTSSIEWKNCVPPNKLRTTLRSESVFNAVT